ncbi:MAG: ATP-binding protein [Myxococcaceae bacterium]|nr:ATP-binding protein [Myxococcaceae bacterium]
MASDAEVERLRARVAQLEKINHALMSRVERSLDEDYESFRTFQLASTLERLVRERTSALEQTQCELEQTNASLRTARDAAEQAAQAKSRFLANMSHEIRTPLNGLIGLLRLIDGEALPPSTRDDMRAATRSAEYLLTLLNDVLDLSRLEAGGATTDPRPFELADLGDALTELFASQAVGQGLTFEVSYPEVRATAVVGDARLIRQALVNLLGNAFKFTAEGRVWLTLSTVQREGALWARFDVEDTGVGIAPEVLARLFKPFSQADASTTRVYGGSGLGLAITRDLAQLLGGAVHVESEPGRGSRFTLEVPVTAWLLPAPPETHVLLDLDETDTPGAFATHSCSWASTAPSSATPSRAHGGTSASPAGTAPRPGPSPSPAPCASSTRWSQVTS